MEMMPNKSKKGEIAMNKEELRKEVLKLIYDKGYRYIVRNIDGIGYIHVENPIKGARYWLSNAKSIRLFFLDKVFEDITFEDSEPLDIVKELGIIDWENIPEDTKVLVSDNGKTWVRRHFAEFDGERTHKFVVYMHGKSSWTSESDDYRPGYKYCKLTEEE
ncbi:hypothetical protein [Veillonella montpellierensis]|uniref:hypothetical protein n=1 Tax=Veillonella montpellierensis TaxID=187328 RepID=UPI0023F677AA|nr:hypothetical protein [Veillonella montpellierensis]